MSIDETELNRLVSEYQASPPDTQMGNKLGKIIVQIVDIVIGSHHFRSYSIDWKDDFREICYTRIITYLKSKYDPKKSTPFKYIQMISISATLQTIKRNKKNYEKEHEVKPDDYVEDIFREDYNTGKQEDLEIVDNLLKEYEACHHSLEDQFLIEFKRNSIYKTPEELKILYPSITKSKIKRNNMEINNKLRDFLVDGI